MANLSKGCVCVTAVGDSLAFRMRLVPEILTQDLKQDGVLLPLAERTTHLGFAEPSKNCPYRRERSRLQIVVVAIAAWQLAIIARTVLIQGHVVWEGVQASTTAAISTKAILNMQTRHKANFE